MLDRYVRPLIDPPLNRMGRSLAQAGVSANAVTVIGLALGLAGAFAVLKECYLCALGLMLASRLADGLDGAVARATRMTDFGGYFDIVADFVFYAAYPLAFVVADPAQNGVAGAALLGAFYIKGAWFLGFAILAAKRNMNTAVRGRKSWYHSGGLLEGTETIVFFVALCVFSSAFVPLAWGFAAACVVTAGARVAMAYDLVRDQG